MRALLPAVLAGGAVAVLLAPGQGARRVRALARPAGAARRGSSLTGSSLYEQHVRGGSPSAAWSLPPRVLSLPPRVLGLPPRVLGLPPAVAAPLLPAGLALAVGAGPVVAALAAVGAASAARWWAARSASVQREQERARAVEACGALAAELRAGRSPAQALAVAAARATGASGRALASAAAAADLGGDVAAVLLSACDSASPDRPVPARGGAARRAPARRAHEGKAHGGPVPARPAHDGRTAVAPVLRALAACWTVCAGTGSGLAAAVERLEEGLRADARQRRALQAELAGPRATAGLLAVLPLAGLLLAGGLGADPLHVLLETPVGLVCLVVGLGLDALGLLWTGRLVARAGGTG